tara:strand:+ start:5399 stop:6190 length:792 start_codon:yes stop_codon:yes gene_type:complete
MKVAVIVPAFKAHSYIEEALVSIKSQEVGDTTEVQTIVICDGCEETFNTASRFADKSTLVCLTENVGTYRARNLGLSLCHIDSDLICNLDADDVWDPLRIADLEEIADEHLNSLSAFSCVMRRVDECGAEITSLDRRACPSGAYVYTGLTVKTIGMYRPWWCGSDNEYRARFYAAGGALHHSKRLLLSYRKHATQLTSAPETLRGTKERDFSYTEIARLKKTNYQTHFQNHPQHNILKWEGARLHKDSTFGGYFASRPLTAGD